MNTSPNNTTAAEKIMLRIIQTRSSIAHWVLTHEGVMCQNTTSSFGCLVKPMNTILWTVEPAGYHTWFLIAGEKSFGIFEYLAIAFFNRHLSKLGR